MNQAQLYIKKGYPIQLLLVSFLFFFAINLSAQNPNFIASANRSEVALNQNFQITYTFNNVDADAFQPPNFEGFTFLGQSQNSSMNIVNTKMTRSVSYIFTLRPTQEGSFEIPPASAKIDGKSAKSNSVTIKVNPANTTTNSTNPAQSQNNSSSNQSIEDQLRQNFYIKAIPSKTTIYEGEQISLNYKILYKPNLQDLAVSKAASFEGFLSQEVEIPDDKKQRQIEDYNGTQFYTSPYLQYALFPTRTGNFNIEPIEVEALFAVERPTRSFFKQYDQIRLNVKSNPINITVKPLPKTNQPESFTGIVGNNFNFSVEYDKLETKVDDPITLKISISGKGNIKLIGPPKFELPQSFEVYDPNIKESISNQSYTLNGGKTFEYLIVPRGGGEFQFPDISFSYFDLASEKYITKTEKGPLVKIEGEAMNSQNGFNPISREEVELLGEDIKFIKTNDFTLSKNRKNIISRPIFHLFTWVPLLLAFFIPIIYKKRKEENKDFTKVKSKKAHKVASKRLALANKLMNSTDEKAFYNEIVKSIWGYLADKFNISIADLTKEKATEMLTEKSVSSNLIEATSTLIGNCEIAVYAPSAIDSSKQVIFSQAETLIENLEKEIGNL